MVKLSQVLLLMLFLVSLLAIINPLVSHLIFFLILITVGKTTSSLHQAQAIMIHTVASRLLHLSLIPSN